MNQALTRQAQKNQIKQLERVQVIKSIGLSEQIHTRVHRVVSTTIILETMRTTSRNVDNPKVFHWSPIFSSLDRLIIAPDGVPNPADIVIWLQFGAWAILITNDAAA